MSRAQLLGSAVSCQLNKVLTNALKQKMAAGHLADTEVLLRCRSMKTLQALASLEPTSEWCCCTKDACFMRFGSRPRTQEKKALNKLFGDEQQREI